jgi:hypothetical protein
MLRFAVKLVSACLTICVVASCGRPNIDIRPFLDEAGFSAPVLVETQPANVIGFRGQLANDANAARFALLVHEGLVSVAPHNGEPWWEYNTASNISNNGGSLSAVLGRRSIVGHADARHWQEEGKEYYAETISYVVDVDSAFRSITTRRLGPFSLRIVLANDPRVGHWQLQSHEFLSGSGTRSSDEDVAINQVLSPLAQAGLQDLPSQIENAKTATFDSIERDLASRGVARGARPDVVVSSTARLAYYTGFGTVFGRDLGNRDSSTMPTELLAAAAQMCRSVSASPYSGWRVPTESELRAVMQPGGEGVVLLDTPDNRLWGRLEVAREDGYGYMIVTSTPTSRMLNGSLKTGIFTFRVFSDRSLINANAEQGYVPPGRWMPICVAPLR